jgi:hypothetical protein
VVIGAVRIGRTANGGVASSIIEPYRLAQSPEDWTNKQPGLRVTSHMDGGQGPERASMPKRFRDVASHTWRSGTNLSVFLSLFVLTAFVLPSIGFKQRLYIDVAGSVMLVSRGAKRLEAPRCILPAVERRCCRRCVEGGKLARPRPRVWRVARCARSCGDCNDCFRFALAGFRRGASHRRAGARRNRGLLGIWSSMGTPSLSRPGSIPPLSAAAWLPAP